jgi:hypothetical protein
LFYLPVLYTLIMVTTTFISALLTSAIVASAAVFDAKSKSNVAVYWVGFHIEADPNV